MTRFGVMKHLKVLEERWTDRLPQATGREKHHFLNPVPIRQIHDRWISTSTASARCPPCSTSRPSLEDTA